MRTLLRSRGRLLLVAASCGACVLQAGLHAARHARARAAAPPELVARAAEIAEIVASKAVDPAEPAALARGALRGLSWGPGDPFTGYLDEREQRAKASSLGGHYGGMGFLTRIEGGPIVVECVFRGGPAATAGIEPGDRLLSIDGETTTGLDGYDVRDRLRGTPGSPVALAVWRERESRVLAVTAVRALIHLPSVAHVGWLDRERGFATLAIRHFQEGTAREALEALTALTAEARLGALVVDLRGNGGGRIGEARGVAGLFLATGVLATARARDDLAREVIGIEGTAAWADLPLVVLVDRETASAAEILSGALQDHRRALVIGERSFGKGSIQDVLPLAGGGALNLTVAHYHTPAGRRILRDRDHRGGVAPDVVVPLTNADRLRLRERLTERDIADSGVYAPGWHPRDLADPALDAARSALAGERIVVSLGD